MQAIRTWFSCVAIVWLQIFMRAELPCSVKRTWRCSEVSTARNTAQVLCYTPSKEKYGSNPITTRKFGVHGKSNGWILSNVKCYRGKRASGHEECKQQTSRHRRKLPIIQDQQRPGAKIKSTPRTWFASSSQPYPQIPLLNPCGDKADNCYIISTLSMSNMLSIPAPNTSASYLPTR